ncbi:MAG: protein translocase subunit SecD [Dehalococcoidales bacterium]|nr:protein translocase subunit SecD [Dehalococcoidales bacterium]
MRTNYWMLAAIAFFVAIAAWVALPDNPGIHIVLGGLKIDRDIYVHRGLDLQGGMQVTLQADVPQGTKVDPDALAAAKAIIDNRINGLGVSEPLIQLQSDTNRILVELPGIKNPEEAIAAFKGTGLLEFIDTGDTSLADGTVVTTSLGRPTETQAGQQPSSTATPSADQTPTAVATPTAETTPTAGATGTPGATGGTSATPAAGSTNPASPAQQTPQSPTVYQTVLTGKDLKSADVRFDEYGQPYIYFSLTSDGAKKFADFTSANVWRYLTITMDKTVLSSPRINSAITQGEGIIEGRFSLDEAKAIVLQLKYGALPVPLKVVENRTIGPTLGEDSVAKSLIAGGIGLAIVAFFMLSYYRFPGLIAVVVLMAYTAIVFAAFKLIPVTLTLAGIAGFILSIGMAVDANILIFERTKEELRSGQSVGAAIEAGFNRAWTSIRDSNISTLITCGILFWFGTSFGASVIRGFALTLAIGVVVSMFTAVTVTRTVLRTLHVWFASNPAWVQRWRTLWVW